MGERRLRPMHVHPCDCGGRYVEQTIDGISIRYNCTDCGEILGDLPMGPEP